MKKYLPHVIIAFLIAIICLFGGDYYNKTESQIATFKKQLEYKSQESINLQKLNWELERQKVDLQLEIESLKESKEVEIVQEKRADGSSSKITKIKTNKEKNVNNSKNVVESSKESATQVTLKEDKKIKVKEDVKEEFRKESKETKKSGATKWVILGAIGAACLLGFIPACAGLL